VVEADKCFGFRFSSRLRYHIVVVLNFLLACVQHVLFTFVNGTVTDIFVEIISVLDHFAASHAHVRKLFYTGHDVQCDEACLPPYLVFGIWAIVATIG
jgi:hypothetical protein